MSAIQDWLNGAEGRPMNPDNSFGLQCVDVIDDFCNYIFGNWVNTITPGNAASLYSRSRDEYFAKLPANTDLQPGDIIVWNENLGGGVGHIAVSDGSYANGQPFNVIQQNGFTNTVPAQRVTWYNRNNVIGILRPKVAADQGGDIVDLDTAKLIAEAMAGRDPNDPANIADLQKYHVGKSAAADIKEWAGSKEHADFKRFQIDNTYRGFLQRPADKSDLDNRMNQPFYELQRSVANSPEASDVSNKYNLIRGKTVKQVQDLIDHKDVPATGGLDQETKDQISETNSIVKKIWDKITSIFK